MTDPVEVPRDAVRTFWPQARPHIERALAATTLPYIAEDVYGSLISGKSFLYLTTEGDDVTGCFVLYVRNTWEIRELYVWISAHQNPNHSVADYLDWLSVLTRKAGCSRWCGDSPRPFHKIVPGLRLESHHFVMEV